MKGNSDLAGNLSAVEVGSAFPETLWTAIHRAKAGQTSEGLEALDRLCQMYHPALRAVLIRWGRPQDEVDDLLQEFFARKFLHENFFANVSPGEGKFRTFLKTCLKNFLRSRHRHESRLPSPISLDLDDGSSNQALFSQELPPDDWMDQAWAQQVMTNARARLEEEAVRAGKAQFYRALVLMLDDDPTVLSQQQIALELGMTENAFGVAIHRFRERFRWFIREEIRQTVTDPTRWKEELEHLVQVLRI